MIQAKNKKEAYEIYSQVSNAMDIYLEQTSEQQALEMLSRSWDQNANKQVGYSEARRMIDENKSRVLVNIGINL